MMVLVLFLGPQLLPFILVVMARSAAGLERRLVWQFAFLGLQRLAVEHRHDGAVAAFCIMSREGTTLLRCQAATGQLHETVAAWLESRPG